MDLEPRSIAQSTLATDSGTFQPPDLQTNQIGRYVLLRRVGEGSMGVVFVAYDERLGRRVALKLLRRRQFGRHENNEKLLREAQALASLSHPNVVQVYEIGEHAGDHYLALEFVEGRTLREWVRLELRSWREITEVYCQAARGLAALHAAGLVHRDVKPDNALIGADGRVRLVDLGLASATVPDDTLPGASGRHDSLVARVSRLSGTPAYMAPEQHLREPAGPRSDQFSFCVALWEALHGTRPFAGATIEEIADNVLAQRIAPPAHARRIPGWLRDALLRGLSRDPARRFVDMDALIAAISPSARAARRQPWIAAALTGVLAFGVAALVRSEGPALCTSGQELAAAQWADRPRAAVRGAFEAASAERAALVFAQVDEALTARVKRWSAAHDAACRARHRGEQSAELFDRRMVCLDQRRLETTMLVEQLTRADATTLEQAIGAALALRPIDDCEDLARLVGEREFRLTRSSAEERLRLTALRERIARAETAERLGHPAEGLRLADEAVPLARHLDQPALGAEALRLRGSLLDRLGRYDEAAPTLLAAYDQAGRAGAESTQAHALLRWLNVVGYHQNQPATAEPWIPVARVMAERTDPTGLLLARFHMAVAPIDYLRGRLRDALAHYEQALARFEAMPAPNPDDIAMALAGLGIIQGQLDELTDAAATNRRSLALFERHFGHGHPRSYFPLVGLADALRAQGELRAALAAYRAAQSIVCGDENSCESSHATLGCIATLIELGDLDAAGALLERALAPEKKQYAAEYARTLAGTLALHRGDVAGARTLLDDALQRSPGHAGLRLVLARTLLAGGEAAAASSEAAAVLAALRAQGAGPLSLAEALVVLGEARLAAGRAAEAAEHLAEAAAIYESKPVDPGRRGVAQFALARALAADPARRADALAPARRAEEALASAESDVRATRAALRAWLDAHPR